MTKASDLKSKITLPKQNEKTKKYIVECLGYGEIDIKLLETKKEEQTHKIEC